VKIALDAAAPPELADAVRLAAAQVGLDVAMHRTADRGAWWREGVAEAVDRTTLVVNRHNPSARVADSAPSAYEVARSPRSTRGASRA